MKRVSAVFATAHICPGARAKFPPNMSDNMKQNAHEGGGNGGGLLQKYHKTISLSRHSCSRCGIIKLFQKVLTVALKKAKCWERIHFNLKTLKN